MSHIFSHTLKKVYKGDTCRVDIRPEFNGKRFHNLLRKKEYKRFHPFSLKTILSILDINERSLYSKLQHFIWLD